MSNNNDKLIKYVFIAAIVIAVSLTLERMNIVTDQLTEPPTRYSEDGVKVDNCADPKCCIASERECPPSISGKNQSKQAAKEDNHKPGVERESVVIAERIRRTDLAAQRGMWRATNALVYLTVWQIIIGGLALGFVAWTLNEARNTTRAANEATKAANRTAEAAESAETAYVRIVYKCEFCNKDGKPIKEDKKPTRGEFIEQKRFFNVTPSIGNFGKTPALNVTYRISQCYVFSDPVPWRITHYDTRGNE